MRCPKLNETPLHCACQNMSLLKGVLSMHKERHNIMKVKDSQGNTPLHTACIGGALIEAILFLLDNGQTQLRRRALMELHHSIWCALVHHLRNKDGMTSFYSGFENYLDNEDGMSFGGYIRYDSFDKQKMVFVAVQQVRTFGMYNKTDKNQSAALGFIKKFVDIEWWNRVEWSGAS
eukprot:4319202-Ditylum_brightwellii.AAC.1